jgi:hypothetical protein
MSDTPRTDALIDVAAWRQPNTWSTQLDVLTEFARQLERELAAYSLMQQLKLIPSYMGGRYRVSSSPESILGQGLFSSRWHESLSDAIEECAAKMTEVA